ncbi:MAG: hypothetical protein ABI661_09635 [Gammaproteobacteria bacterium]
MENKMITRNRFVKAKTLGISGTLLTSLLSVGAATPVYASGATVTTVTTPAFASGTTVEKDDCRVVFETPIAVTHTSPKLIDYPVKATCGPNTKLEIQQRWAEDDTAWGDWNEVGPWRTVQQKFKQPSGRMTLTLHYKEYLPDTEGGPEEMFHEGYFRVKSGPLVGRWSGLLQSRNASISN